MQSVGVDLYAELLEDAIRAARGEETRTVFDPELQFPVQARIPEEYVDADGLRLRFYKRFSNADEEEVVLALLDELTERFGAPPGSVLNLVELMRIRCLAKRLGLANVEQSQATLNLTFAADTPIEAPLIFDLIQNGSGRFTVPANYKLRYEFTAEERAHTLVASRTCLQGIVDLAHEKQKDHADADM